MLCNILEILCYRILMQTYSSENATCCNMPGVLTVGWCYTSLSSTYIKCVVPTSKHSPSWKALAYVTRPNTQSVRCVYACPLLFFLEVPFPGEAAMEKVRRLCTNMHKHLHIWDAWQELSSWSTVTGRQVLPFFLRSLCWNMFQMRYLPLQTGRSGNILMFVHSTDRKYRSCINKNITTVLQ